MKPLYPYLEKIDSPADLKQLKLTELQQVCDEVRAFLIDALSKNPGHFGASLGVVELTVALHYVFDTPSDALVWDVGHQAYAHKILTGRRDQFETNRKLGGLCGFPKMDESPYDAFGVGHSSTSISAALGLAVVSKMKQDHRNVVAVIGDGSLTGGMAFEGLNNGGHLPNNMLVILNDNDMAIDKNTGALRDYLLSITTSRVYNRVKEEMWWITARWLAVRKIIQKIRQATKTYFLKQSNLFESFGFRYFGPVDGHDIEQLVKVLTKLKQLDGPKLLHVSTIKGKGYKPAEADQTRFHAPGKFDRQTGAVLPAGAPSSGPRYQDVFGETLLELAKQNPAILGVTPAMPSGCSMNIMMQEMPARCFDVGIAEQHAVTFSAGLAVAGMQPFCNIYSSFMQRAYDSIIHDVALQKLNVVFCLDRGGLVGEDGATHHGVFDLAYMRSIPNMTVAAPMDEIELRNLMYTAQCPQMGPFSIRYPRGSGRHPEWKQAFERLEVGSSRCLREGTQVAVLSLGDVGRQTRLALEQLAQKGKTCTHIDVRFLKPLDEKMLHRVCQEHAHLITVENGTVVGGLGSAVAEFILKHGYTIRLTTLGVPDTFIEHGTVAELQKICGIDQENIEKTVETIWM